ncbi:MAG: hypothetical protein L0Z62_22670 [Gemmataceae bacterium]|nr:hypothetical protein [Gemmataceae bacterium]
MPWNPIQKFLITERPAGMTFTDVLRDVVGNPFRPVLLKDVQAHLSPEVQAIVCSIYEERRLEELPVLADALEEAGCVNTTFLDHLRSPQPHSHACWALALARGASDPPVYTQFDLLEAERRLEEKRRLARLQRPVEGS